MGSTCGDNCCGPLHMAIRLPAARNRSLRKSRPSAECLARATDYLTSGRRAKSSIETSVFRSPPFHFVCQRQCCLHVAAIVGLHLRHMAAVHPSRGRLTPHSSRSVQGAVLVVHSHVLFAFLTIDADRGWELCVVA